MRGPDENNEEEQIEEEEEETEELECEDEQWANSSEEVCEECPAADACGEDYTGVH